MGGVSFGRTSLSNGLSKFFMLAQAAQLASGACVAAADEERKRLLQQQGTLQSNLQALPGQLEIEEERLLRSFATVLNEQKRLCRNLWQSGRRQPDEEPQ